MSDSERKLLKDILVYTNAFLIVFLPQSVNSDKINSEVCYTGSPLSRNQGVNLFTTLFLIPLALKEMTGGHALLQLELSTKRKKRMKISSVCKKNALVLENLNVEP